MKNVLRFILTLFAANLVAASVLACVYQVTKPKIEMRERMIQEEALRQVMPESVGDRLEPVYDDGEVKYWKAFRGSGEKVQGYVFIAEKYGYSSSIKTMVGIRRDGRITGVRILSQSETPGLGTRIIEVVSDKTLFKALRQLFSEEPDTGKSNAPYFTEQFTGADVRRIELSKEGIQAITGATISSRAVLDSIRSEGLEILDER